MDPDLARRVAAAYAAGATQRQVSEGFGTYPRQVRAALAAEGVPARGAGERFVAAETVAVWVGRYEAGESIAQIATGSGHTPRVVSRELLRAGVQRHGRKRRWSDGDLDDIVARYVSGEGTREVAASYGVSQNRIRQLLRGASRPISSFQAAHLAARAASRPDPPPRPRRLVRRGYPKARNREELLAVVRSCAAEIAADGRLAAATYEAWAAKNAGPSRAVLLRVFGSWTEVIQAAGYLPAQDRRRTYTRLSWQTAVDAVGAYLRDAVSGGRNVTGQGYQAWAKTHPGAPSAAGLALYWRWSDLVAAAAGLDTST